MYKTDTPVNLKSYFARGTESNRKISEVLGNNKDIDIFYGHDTCFKLAIQSNNIDGLQMLVDYYAEHTLSKYKIGSDEYLHAKAEFATALNHGLEYAPPKTPEDLANVRAFVREHAGYCYDDIEEEDELDDSDIEYYSGSDEQVLTEDSEKQHNRQHNNDTNFEQELYTYLDRDALSLHDKLIGE